MPTPRTGRRARTARETPQPDDAAVGSLSTKRSSRGALATVYSEAAPLSGGAAVLGLQGTAGNRAVARLLRSQREARPRRLQPKLMVGSANDPLEREADRVAELVMRTWSSRSANACAEQGGEVPIQRLADPGRDPASVFQADDSVAKRLDARSGSGQVLPAVVRNRMEAGFGTDFSSVRIHRDAEAAELSTGLAARAFTHGTDIYFAAGAYEPGSRSGRHLLAHELTHVVQQGGAPVHRKPEPRPGEFGDGIRDTGRQNRQAFLAHELPHTAQQSATPAVQRVEIGDRPFADAYSTLIKDPAWHEETAAFERRLGTYAYNHPSAMAAARKSITRLAAAPRVSRVESREVVRRGFKGMLAGEVKARAGKVFVGAVLAESLRKSQEHREQLTMYSTDQRPDDRARPKRPYRETSGTCDARHAQQAHQAITAQPDRGYPHSLSSPSVLQLQHAVGNQALAHLLSGTSQGQRIQNESAVIQRTVSNSTKQAQFFPLYNLKIMDEAHYYLYHGTFADNLGGIGREGLDPRQGGGPQGSQRYERQHSSDAIGLMKYATDPNIAMIYAKEPTEMDRPEVGVLLEARVKKKEIRALFNDATAWGDKTPFWRRERGGENKRVGRGGLSAKVLALNEPGGLGEAAPILALETNQPVVPSDLKVIGFYLPPNTQIDERELVGKLNHKVAAVAIDMNTFEQSKIYEDAWQNFGKL